MDQRLPQCRLAEGFASAALGKREEVAAGSHKTISKLIQKDKQKLINNAIILNFFLSTSAIFYRKDRNNSIQ